MARPSDPREFWSLRPEKFPVVWLNYRRPLSPCRAVLGRLSEPRRGFQGATPPAALFGLLLIRETVTDSMTAAWCDRRHGNPGVAVVNGFVYGFLSRACARGELWNVVRLRQCVPLFIPRLPHFFPKGFRITPPWISYAETA